MKVYKILWVREKSENKRKIKRDMRVEKIVIDIKGVKFNRKRSGNKMKR